MDLNEIKETKKTIEKNNKRLVRTLAIIWGCIVGCVTIFAIILTIIAKLKFFEMVLIIFIPAFPSAIICLIVGVIVEYFTNKKEYAKMKEFSKKYKSEYVLKYLNEVFTDVNYKPNAGFTREYLKSSCNALLYDRFSSNDYISCKYKNINIEFADVDIEEEHTDRDSDGNTRTYYVTIFKGKWMVFDFNKPFKYDMIVSGTSHVMSIGGTKHIKMEDDNFNTVYKVYAKSEHEAFYILTPHMMNKMRALYHKLGDHGISFGFIKNKLYVVFNDYEDSFELNSSKEISEESFKKQILGDIKEITNFVDGLDLTNDIFK